MRRASVLLALAALGLVAALPGMSEGEEGKSVEAILIRAGTGIPPVKNTTYNDGFPPPEVIIIRKDGMVHFPHQQGYVSLSGPGPRAAKPTALLVSSSWGRIKRAFDGETAFPLTAAGAIPLAKKGGTPGPPDKGGGGGGGGSPALLDLEEGMLTAGLSVNLGRDNTKRLSLDTHAFQGAMNFTDPGDWFQYKGNIREPDITQEEGDALQAELAPGNAIDNGSFYLQIDKVGLAPGGATSGDHFLNLDYVGALGETRMQIGGPYDTPVTVVWLSHTETVDVFQFTGTILVGTTSGGRKNSRVIGCPGVGPEPNKVVVTLTR